MNKQREYECGREDGLDLAYRIVKEGGIEALEKELKFRNVTGIHTSLAAKDLNKASEKIKEMAFDTFRLLVVSSLHDEFGYGEKRCNRILNRMDLKAECINDNLVTWEDYIKLVKEELNLELEIRWNK